MSSVDLHACAYCGLPAPRSWWDGPAAGPSYCCYGCRFAANVVDADGARPESRRMFTRLGLAIFCTMNVMAFTMALWSSDVYEDESTTTAQLLSGIFRYLSMLFSFPVYYALGLPLLENAWDSLKRGIANIDILLVIGVGASYAVSAFSVLRDDGPIYFEVGCTVLVLVTLGRWLEATCRSRASHALDALEKLQPERVRVVVAEGEVERSLREVVAGDRLRVLAGERIACDGRLEHGPVHIDEQLLTGESAVRCKERGDPLFAGTLNVDGNLVMTVTAAAADGTLARLVRMVRQARATRGRFEQLADRVSRWFLPAVIVVSLGAGVYHGVARDAMTGVLVGMSVVLIACPCALGIATPLAMWVALNHAARQRILIQGGDVLERLARVDQVCFDKTGTLTTGTPGVGQAAFADARHLAEAATLAAASRHVYAVAIARQLGMHAESTAQIATVAGRGVRADDSGAMLGSETWMAEAGVTIPSELRQTLDGARRDGNAVVCFASQGCLRGVFVLVEDWRPELDDALAQLQAENVKLSILSGDPNFGIDPWCRRPRLYVPTGDSTVQAS
ncbi:MAG TPA: HAD-IC family P-type ATPase, partial [Gemmataceae bacterium]|nr:HAD-IC family P-type ATPase [Gemmataceae bacterium]